MTIATIVGIASTIGITTLLTGIALTAKRFFTDADREHAREAELRRQRELVRLADNPLDR